MTQEQIREFMKSWIAEKKGLKAESLSIDEHLFQSGYLDSLSLFRLIFDIETAFDVEFDQEKLFSSGATNITDLSTAMMNSVMDT